MRTIPIIVIFLIFAIGVFLVFQKRTAPSLPEPSIAPTGAVTPEDVPPPFIRTVKSVDPSLITVTGEEGDMVLPQDPKIVLVSRKTKSGTVDASLSDVAVGDTVEVTVIVPGEKVLLLLLEDRL